MTSFEKQTIAAMPAPATREDWRKIHELNAGRELDAEIATLMGWTWDDVRASSPGESNYARTNQEGDRWWWLPRYSERIEEAFYAAEKFLPYMVLVRHDSGRFATPRRVWWSVRLSENVPPGYLEDPSNNIKADTAPLAICRAIINAYNK